MGCVRLEEADVVGADAKEEAVSIFEADGVLPLEGGVSLRRWIGLS